MVGNQKDAPQRKEELFINSSFKEEDFKQERKSKTLISQKPKL